MSNRPKVYFNGSCPVCSAEIGHYRTLDGAAGIDWCDVALDPQALAVHGIDGESARRRLHVIDEQGQLQRGVDGFRALWTTLPSTRWLARIIDNRAVRPVVDWIYEGVLAPLLYWRDRRRRLAKQAPGH